MKTTPITKFKTNYCNMVLKELKFADITFSHSKSLNRKQIKPLNGISLIWRFGKSKTQ